MSNDSTVSILLAALIVTNPIGAGPALAQDDLQGRWATTLSEDVDMTPGAELGNYSGLPLNDAARRYADSWAATRYGQLEHQCRSHTLPYILRAPTWLRIGDDIDPDTHATTSIRIYMSVFEHGRVIWMDGRAHPPPEAPHTWLGFSTGRWEDDVLVVETSHIKHGYLRRNGVPQSDRATVTEYYVRHGDLLTITAVTTDPIYLTEMFVKSQTFILNGAVHDAGRWSWPCDTFVESIVEEGATHFFPGENPFLGEFTYGLPEQALRGYSETLVPGYLE